MAAYGRTQADSYIFDLVRHFLDRAERVTKLAELGVLIEDVIRELGFRYFALLHHVDPARPRCGTIHINNYPEAWSDHFVRKRLFLHDPVLQASLRTNVGFAWDDISRLIPLTTCHQAIFEKARREGMGSGFTVPANIPGEIHGSCSFATSNARPLPRRNLMAAQLVGAFAFQRARRLCRRGCELSSGPVRLTDRQHECLVLAGRGKTDWEIGSILGLKEDTVNKYLVAARERYDVTTRTQLVTAALYAGEISFLEIYH